MPTVGVRELKTHATRIVRAVREDQAEYVITVDGQPVAVLRPYTALDGEARQAAVVDELLERIERLAAENGDAGSAERSALELLGEERGAGWSWPAPG
jgi:prevent-host-death family protein